MMVKMKHILTKKSVWVSVSLVFVLFMAFVLPWINDLIDSRIVSTMSPDTSLFYSVESFYIMLEDYTREGRLFYILIRWTFDLIYPLVYGLFFLTIIVNLMPRHQTIKAFIFIPLLGVLFDYLENIVATIHMAIYPSQLTFLVYVLQGFSLLKWLFLGLSMLVIIYELSTMLFQRIKK